MEIYRFDDEVSLPVRDFGSLLRIGRLADVAGARVSVMHLPAGGTIGEHPAAGRQFFAVVAGSGWVVGGDGARRRLQTGWGAELPPDCA